MIYGHSGTYWLRRSEAAQAKARLLALDGFFVSARQWNAIAWRYRRWANGAFRIAARQRRVQAEMAMQSRKRIAI